MTQNFIPFGRPNISEEEIEAVSEVLRSGWIGQGPQVAAFEEEFAQFVQADYAVSLNSCTAALHLALEVLGIGPGDEVIVPSLTWCSTANAALYVGAKPVFCDIHPDTLCADIDDIISRITSRTKAVIVVHFGGRAVDVEDLRSRLPSRIEIIEDAAHALAARYPNGRPVGSSKNLCCFSFYANKNITTGEGGALTTSRPHLAELARSLRQHGLATNAWKRFTDAKVSLGGAIVERLGYKMNFTDLQAALGRVQLRRLPLFQERRQEVAKIYSEHLSSLEIQMQSGLLSPYHARHLFPIRTSQKAYNINRNDLLAELKTRKIGAAVHYAPLHMMPVYNCDYHLPITEMVYTEILTLPISSTISNEEISYVVDQLRNLLSISETQASKESELSIHEHFESALSKGILEILLAKPELAKQIDDNKIKLVYGKSLRHCVEVDLSELMEANHEALESLDALPK